MHMSGLKVPDSISFCGLLDGPDSMNVKRESPSEQQRWSSVKLSSSESKMSAHKNGPGRKIASINHFMCSQF